MADRKRTVCVVKRVDNARGTFTAGDLITGWEWNVKPLVDSGAAEWYEPDAKPEEKATRIRPEVPVGRGRFPGIDFGSDVAYEMARDADPPLAANDFREREGSGSDGAFVKADIEAILADRER